MKINCGLTRRDKATALANWHDHFAWWPVRVGERDCRWLELVERRAEKGLEYLAYCGYWEYRSRP